MSKELRMYGFVPYNISEIQKGIQFGHAVVEYGLKHFKDIEYQEWANEYKTFIILNGGTTNNTVGGSIQKTKEVLERLKIKHACFYEPDLNDTLTAVVFIIDSDIFGKEIPEDLSIDQMILRDWIQTFRLA